MKSTTTVEADDRTTADNADLFMGVSVSHPTPTATILPMFPAVWTGRLEFEIYNSFGWSVAPMEIVGHLDTIEVWCSARCVAVVRREKFRAWLSKKSATLSLYDIAWTKDGGHSCIVIRESPPYAVRDDVVSQLSQVI